MTKSHIFSMTSSKSGVLINGVEMSACSLHVPDTDFTLPNELHVIETIFISFYRTVHDARRLTWLHHLFQNWKRLTQREIILSSNDPHMRSNYILQRQENNMYFSLFPLSLPMSLIFHYFHFHSQCHWEINEHIKLKDLILVKWHKPGESVDVI